MRASRSSPALWRVPMALVIVTLAFMWRLVMRVHKVYWMRTVISKRPTINSSSSLMRLKLLRYLCVKLHDLNVVNDCLRNENSMLVNKVKSLEDNLVCKSNQKHLQKIGWQGAGTKTRGEQVILQMRSILLEVISLLCNQFFYIILISWVWLFQSGFTLDVLKGFPLCN